MREREAGVVAGIRLSSQVRLLALPPKQPAAALVELALLLALVAILVIGALAWQGKWAGAIFEGVNSGIEVDR